MTTRTFRTANLFSGDAVALVNGLARVASHLMMAPVERIAMTCDVGGILVFRRAGFRLYRAAEREGHLTWKRIARRGPFACLHYLSELS